MKLSPLRETQRACDPKSFHSATQITRNLRPRENLLRGDNHPLCGSRTIWGNPHHKPTRTDRDSISEDPLDLFFLTHKSQTTTRSFSCHFSLLSFLHFVHPARNARSNASLDAHPMKRLPLF